MSIRSSILASSLVLFVASNAGAQNAALAEKLFREGKKLLDKKSYAEACPKLAESARLDPASGTLLALGLCHEGQGKTASAWADYTEAASVAKRDNRPDREKAALQKASQLEPKLARVTFDVAAATTTKGLEVRQDDVVMGSAGWKDAPVDAGEHVLEVTAPGKKPFKTTFTVTTSEKKIVAVPALEDVPVATSVAPEKKSSPLKTAGFVTGGVGIASLVASGIFGAVAIAKNGEGKSACPMKTCANPSGVDANHAAETFADLSTVLFIAGVVLTGAGVTMVIVSPSKTSTMGLVLTPIGAGGTF